MPKFLYSIIFLTVILWVFFGYFGTVMPPNSPINILSFLIFFFLAISFTLSLFFYFIRVKLPKCFPDKRTVYKRCMRWGFYLGFGIAGTMALKAFGLITPLNYSLFGVFLIALFFQLKAARRDTSMVK
jgi:hypothetical protein